MRPAVQLGILGFAAVLLAACSGQRGPAVGAVRPTNADSLYIFVDNQNFLDATVYVSFVGTARRRLGSVTGQTRREYAIRWSGSEMSFTVDFVGSRAQRSTQRFTFRRGESVELRIPPSATNPTGRLIVMRR